MRGAWRALSLRGAKRRRNPAGKGRHAGLPRFARNDGGVTGAGFARFWSFGRGFAPLYRNSTTETWDGDETSFRMPFGG
ncbi:MAG: hypothetical protein LBT00_04865 [Spirochaetaceae bacterium]|nr:hypothetical protein [Spirochaetaceae bacterium]